MCWNKRHMNLPSVHFGNSSLPLEEQQHGLVQKWYLVLFLTNRAIFGWGSSSAVLGEKQHKSLRISGLLCHAPVYHKTRAQISSDLL